MALALAMVASVPFLPTLRNGFAGWDDTVNFLTNRDFRGLAPDNLRWAWTTYLMGVYQPLGWMIYELEFAAWGMEPRGYHLVSLLFHAANAVALWALTCALVRRVEHANGLEGVGRETAAIAAAVAVAIFAVHPLRVEAVAWASCQSYLPGILFAILSAIAYLRACEPLTTHRTVWLALAWAIFGLALLTKVAVIGLPFVLLILDIYPLRRIGPGHWVSPEASRVYREKLLFLVLAVPFMIVAVQARWPSEERPAVGFADILPRLAQSVYGVWFYPIKTIFPVGLSAQYPLPARVRDYTRWPFLAAAAMLAIVLISAYRFRRRFPGLVAAGLCYLVCLAPSLGIIRTSHNIAADRYSYVASMAGVVVLAYVLTRIARRATAWPVSLAVALVLTIGLSALTWRQCLTWRSTESLWIQTGSIGRPHYETQLRAGVARFREGRTLDAQHHFLQALTDVPESVPALVNLGGLYWKLDRLDEAEEMWTRAIALRPDSAESLAGLGLIRARRPGKDLKIR